MSHGNKTDSESALRRQRVELIRSAANAGKPPMPKVEELSPWIGLDPDSARAMAELFPCPNPDVVMARRLRRAYGSKNKSSKYSACVTLPREVLYVAGFRTGDTVLISAWAEGVIRLVRIPEGQ